MRRWHDGRLKDSWQVPHKNRSVYLQRFWFELPSPKNPRGNYMGLVVAVPPPVETNLKKHRDEVIAANKEQWFRPKFKQIYMGKHNGKDIYRYAPVLDEKTGRQIIESFLKKVDAVFLGADK